MGWKDQSYDVDVPDFSRILAEKRAATAAFSRHMQDAAGAVTEWQDIKKKQRHR